MTAKARRAAISVAAALSAALSATLLAAGPAAAFPYGLSLKGQTASGGGCAVALTLTNASETVLKEIGGHLVAFRDEAEIGASEHASFLQIPAGESGVAAFTIPGPCDAATSLAFVLRTCLGERGFLLRDACARRIRSAPPLRRVIAR